MAKPRKLCTADGCREAHFGLGYCYPHYRRFKNHGDPFGARVYETVPPESRFLRRVKKTDGCWLWTGALTPGGYGKFQIGGAGSPSMGAHRFSFFMANGFYPEIVMHKCDTPSCVNPSHLQAGTQKDNIRDMMEKGRRPRIGPTGDRNFNTKLDEEKVRKIRAFEGSMSANAAGKLFGVNHRTILAIWRGITWRQVD